MAIDNTPATTVQSMLNGINYSALIGGPLQAAVTAQAMAAKSTWEFIQEVGMNTDKNGEKSAVNVTFLYQKDGNMTKLIVPLLTIVPIPMIVIDEVNIEFKASMNASSSTCTEESSSTATDVGGEFEAKVGWGPFSAKLSAKANYSSKKDSKATAESKYSVEYTQDVRVHASQADMPAGLATVLNILSLSAQGDAGVDGKIEVEKNVITPSATEEQACSITVKDSRGLILKGAKVHVSLVGAAENAAENSGLVITQGHIRSAVTPNSDITLDKGTTVLYFKAKENTEIPPMVLTLKTIIGDKKEVETEINIEQLKLVKAPENA